MANLPDNSSLHLDPFYYFISWTICLKSATEQQQGYTLIENTMYYPHFFRRNDKMLQRNPLIPCISLLINVFLFFAVGVLFLKLLVIIFQNVYFLGNGHILLLFFRLRGKIIRYIEAIIRAYVVDSSFANNFL